MLLLFAKSLLLGIAIAAPVGPIGALCINRTLQRGFWAGVGGGLGTALADAVYASLAAIGFATFAAVLATISKPLAVVGGLFMLYLAWTSLRSQPAAVAASGASKGLLATVATTFLLTIANPMTILSFAAIFSGLGLAGLTEGPEALIVVAGVFLGSLAWWFALSGAVSLARTRLSSRFAAWVSRASGLIIGAFGVTALASVAFSG